MAVTHGGRFGVGISVPFPCVDGEQLGSVAGVQVMQTPVKGSLLGEGVVKTSERVCRKATIWFSSLSVKPSVPLVLSRLSGTSFIGHQVTPSMCSFRHC